VSEWEPDPRIVPLIDWFLLNETKWAELEWSSWAPLRDYLFHAARRALEKKRQEQEQERSFTNRKILAAVMAANRYPELIRTELARDIDKAFAPVERSMRELSKYCHTLAKAADDRTAVVDRKLVAKAYGIPMERIDDRMERIERKWGPELALLRLKLGLYVKRRPVHFDTESGRFEILPDEAA